MAIHALFNSPNQDLPHHKNDTNMYILGCLGNHNMIAAYLPYKENSINAASKVALDIEKSFPSIKWYFVVGIGGGAPSEKHNIRLGDAIVSTAIIQHDKGKRIQNNSNFQNMGIMHQPARSLMTTICWLQSDLNTYPDFLDTHIKCILSLRPEYRSPKQEEDRLFQPYSKHKYGQKTCRSCKGPEVHRKPQPAGPNVHYSLITSRNQVMKDATVRDWIDTNIEVLCFEIEGAGVIITRQCLII
jgi:nucleoside phosphorylase